MTDERLAFRITEAARLMSVSPGFLYKLAARGEIRTVRLGKALLIPRREIERLLAGGGEEP